MKRLIVDLPDHVHRSAKMYAVEHDIPLRTVIELGIHTLLNGNKTPQQTAKEIARGER